MVAKWHQWNDSQIRSLDRTADMHRRRFFERTLQVTGGMGCLPSGLCAARQTQSPESTTSTPDRTADSRQGQSMNRNSAVVDAYSACVKLTDLERANINVVIQAVTSEELLVQIPPNADSAAPPPGVDIWENVFTGEDVVKRIRQSIDRQLEDIEASTDRIALALTVEEAVQIVQEGKIALFLMLKSGWINHDLEVLRMYYRLGIRVMALCHLASFAWSDSSAELKERPGLSEFGRDVVRECNQLGILIDVSHASDATFWHTLETTQMPIISSHSRCRALSNSMRDLSDDMLVAISRNGGVAGILAATPRTNTERTNARLQRDRALANRFSDPFELAAAKRQDAIVWSTKLNLRHIDYAVKMAGINHVAVASHCQSVPQWQEFSDVLVRHGYSPDEADRILGGNVLRVLEQGNGQAD